jgi:purine-cytosine permease-like protein
MAHNPINHPARPIYRVISGLIGLYLVLFGVLGLFADGRVFGQGTNVANSLVSIVLGAIILIATVVGRNVDAAVNKYLGYALMALGLLTLAFLRTDANVLDHTVSTSIVWMLLGITLLVAGMYGKVGTSDEQEAWEKGRLVF